jgi:protein-L-isoaspartate O-methyltransferase
LTEDYTPHQAALVAHLTATGVLHTPAWIEAFASVARHPFLGGRVYLQDDTGPYTRWRPVIAGSPGWFELVYRDIALVTQLDGTERPWSEDDEPVAGVPTSSSSMPTVMALMMEELQAERGQRVLEIGTGTGWSTALLASRFGGHMVTSVELDGAIGRAAAEALHGCGAEPTLVIGDGLAGHAPTAPFDRIISTCSVRTVPAAWLAQAAPTARIITPLRGWMEASGLLELTVGNDGTARGGFADVDIGFMFARSHTPPPIGALPDPATGLVESNEIGADLLRSRADRTGRWILQLALPDALTFQIVGDGQTVPVLHDPASGATAWVYPDRVTEVGAGNLWPKAQSAVQSWREAGSPPLRDFQVVASATDLMVSHPAMGVSFTLPTG